MEPEAKTPRTTEETTGMVLQRPPPPPPMEPPMQMLYARMMEPPKKQLPPAKVYHGFSISNMVYPFATYDEEKRLFEFHYDEETCYTQQRMPTEQVTPKIIELLRSVHGRGEALSTKCSVCSHSQNGASMVGQQCWMCQSGVYKLTA
jgi:hypothetical protein